MEEQIRVPELGDKVIVELLFHGNVSDGTATVERVNLVREEAWVVYPQYAAIDGKWIPFRSLRFKE